MRRPLLAGLGAAAAALALAAPAGADSIAYVKDGDAWLATPDGTRQLQVTRTGDVSFVSQADDGTMIALVGGERLRKIGRDGRTLAEFATYVSDGAPASGPTNRFHGPFAPQISPDGSLVAFEWFNDTYTEGAGCDAVNGCYLHRGSQGVGITRSDRFTAYDEFGILTGWIGPRWLSSDTLLRTSSGANFNEDTVLSKVGPGVGGTQLDRWFKDQSGRGALIDVVYSPDSGVVVGVGGAGEDQLRFYRTLYAPSEAPEWNPSPWADNVPVVEQCFERNVGRVEEPSLAPGGRAVAYGTPEGIRTAALPDMRGGSCPAPPAGETLVIPGGRHPDWGPADVPASIPGAAGPGGNGRASAPERSPADDVRPGGFDEPVPGPRPAKFGLAASRTTLGAVRRSGLPVRVDAPSAGKVTVTATVARKAAGTVRRRVAGAGVVDLRVPVARRALRGGATRSVVLRATFVPRGGGATRRTTTRVRVGRR